MSYSRLLHFDILNTSKIRKNQPFLAKFNEEASVGNEQHARSAAISDKSAQLVSRFCYRIDSHVLLLEATLTAEVLTTKTIHALPFAPDWCVGLVSLRGDLFPVMDMHKVVLGKSSPQQTQLLLVQHPQFSPIILTCDGFPRQLKLSQGDLTEHTPENLPSWIPHTLQHNGQTLLAADHGRLLRQIRQTAPNR
jgi:chemotaxis signal transduction protein